MIQKYNSFFLLIILAINLLTTVDTRLSSSNVEIAINCGGPEFRTKNGIVFQKDEYYNGGESSNFGMESDIKNTKNKEIYQTERWSSEDLIYTIPIKKTGKFVLILKFSEVYFNNKGEKIFDVKIGDTTILKDVDIYAKAGKNTAYDEYIEFEIKENKMFIDKKEVPNGYNDDEKTISITFAKKEADNPKVNAILIVKGTLKDTDYEEYQHSLEIMEKKKQEMDKKNREFQRMSKTIDFEDFEDDFTDDGKKYRVSNGLFSGQSLFFTVVTIGVVYYIFFARKK